MRTMPTSMRIDGGATAAAGMSDCYESIPRTLIRDGRLPSGVEREKCSAGACPTLGSRRSDERGHSGGSRNPGGKGGANDARTLPPISGSQVSIPWFAGTSRHGRLERKHVPDSDPG